MTDTNYCDWCGTHHADDFDGCRRHEEIDEAFIALTESLPPSTWIAGVEYIRYDLCSMPAPETNRVATMTDTSAENVENLARVYDDLADEANLPRGWRSIHRNTASILRALLAEREARSVPSNGIVDWRDRAEKAEAQLALLWAEHAQAALDDLRSSPDGGPVTDP